MAIIFSTTAPPARLTSPLASASAPVPPPQTRHRPRPLVAQTPAEAMRQFLHPRWSTDWVRFHRSPLQLQFPDLYPHDKSAFDPTPSRLGQASMAMAFYEYNLNRGNCGGAVASIPFSQQAILYFLQAGDERSTRAGLEAWEFLQLAMSHAPPPAWCRNGESNEFFVRMLQPLIHQLQRLLPTALPEAHLAEQALACLSVHPPLYV